jgi:hypothetical protein
MARRWLHGYGIEIGGLHRPVILPDDVSAKYIDLRTWQEASKLNALEVIVPDIVTNGFLLETIEDESVDFIVANHLLEHSPDLYGTLKRWVQKLRFGGVVYAALPIVDRCFDNGRPITIQEHFFEDHNAFANASIDEVLKRTHAHLIEFALISGRQILSRKNEPHPPYDDVYRFVDGLVRGLQHGIKKSGATTWDELIRCHGEFINMHYDIHYHTFLPSSIKALMERICEAENLELADMRKSGGGECIVILRKKMICT